MKKTDIEKEEFLEEEIVNKVLICFKDYYINNRTNKYFNFKKMHKDLYEHIKMSNIVKTIYIDDILSLLYKLSDTLKK